MLLAPVLLHKPLAKQHYWLWTKKNSGDKNKNWLQKEVSLVPANPGTHSYACWLLWTLCLRLRSQCFLIICFRFWLFPLSSVNILCNVSSNAGSFPGARGAFPANLRARRPDRFRILCMRPADLASYALSHSASSTSGIAGWLWRLWVSPQGPKETQAFAKPVVTCARVVTPSTWSLPYWGTTNTILGARCLPKVW